MKIIPKTKEQILKDRLKTITNAEKAGLTYIGNSIYADESVYPTEFYRFSYPKSVKDFEKIIYGRNGGNKESYAVQMIDFESLIPESILSVMVNRKIEKVLKKKVELDMAEQNLSTETPENVYDPDKKDENDKNVNDYFNEIGEGYSYDLCTWHDKNGPIE